MKPTCPRCLSILFLSATLIGCHGGKAPSPAKPAASGPERLDQTEVDGAWVQEESLGATGRTRSGNKLPRQLRGSDQRAKALPPPRRTFPIGGNAPAPSAGVDTEVDQQERWIKANLKGQPARDGVREAKAPSVPVVEVETGGMAASYAGPGKGEIPGTVVLRGASGEPGHAAAGMGMIETRASVGVSAGKARPPKDGGERSTGRHGVGVGKRDHDGKKQIENDAFEDKAFDEENARGDLVDLAASVDDLGETLSHGDDEGVRGGRGRRGYLPPPDHFLPRSFYFENTYLGGDAAHAEWLRRLDGVFPPSIRPYGFARAYAQPFDPPAGAGMAIRASLDRRWIEEPGRVYLQIGLRGSDRYGWRRPPLDMVLVVDPAVLGAEGDLLSKAVAALLGKLGPQDRFGLVIAQPGARVLTPLGRMRGMRVRVARQLDSLKPAPAGAGRDIALGLQKAGALLRASAKSTVTVPGTQVILLLAGAPSPEAVQAAAAVAHGHTVEGMVTSVIETTAGTPGGWWSVAAAGHGNDHMASGAGVRSAVDQEIASLSRIVARLLRVNVRLGAHVKAVRVLGSRRLDAREVARVKAREEATDRNLSKTLGITSDRGDDDDGIQTVIPYFYGGDAHVIVLELWVDRPGPVADITIRYKDMVGQRNATARASVDLKATPRDDTPEQLYVRRNLRGLLLAEKLDEVASRVRSGQVAEARSSFSRAMALADPSDDGDRRLMKGLARLIGPEQRSALSLAPDAVAQALEIASRRKVGLPPR